MKNMFARIIREEDGQGMVEYGLIIAGIALAVIGAIWLFGADLVTLFTDISFEAPAAT